MDRPKELIAEMQAPDTEVELSADDLRELAEPLQPPPKTKVIAAAAPVQVRRQAPVSRLSLAAMLVIGAIGTLSLIMALSDAPESSAPQLAQQPPQAALPAAETKVEAKPVLFVNPFDAQEVFEFPAGTSEAEARDKVAQILMERAMQRQGQWDTLVSKDH